MADSEITGFLERIASGIEKLAEDPVIHMETGPPVCPHCGKMNPRIQVDAPGGSGRMAEYVIQAQCNSCTRTFYALPLQWQTMIELQEVEAALIQVKELGGHGDNGSQ